VKAITGELDLNLFNADDENNTAFYPSVTLEGLKTAGEFALDITPIVGDIKAATELPEDMRMARALIEEGYEEGDIIDMGLGGALGALSIAGFIPAGGAVADVIKKGVKETAKSRMSEQTKEMLERQARISERAEILAKDKGILTKDVGTQFRGRNVPQGQLHRAEFSGEPKEKPTPKVFHGAASMRQASKSDMAEGIEDLNNMQEAYIKSGSNKMFDLLSDKRVGAVQGQPFNSPDQVLNMDDIIKFQEDRPFDGIQVPILREPNQPIDVVTTKIVQDGDNKRLYRVKEFNTETGETGDVIGFITPDASNNITKGELDFNFKTISDSASKVMDRKATRTRAEKIREEGLQSFKDFRGEVGLDKFATGQHAELKEPMMSFSRDPLVAMKPGFGAGDTENIIYADLPPELTRNMTPEEYKKAMIYGKGSLPLREPGQIGFRLPKSIHLEGEEAITNPELLDAKVLADNYRLEQKVQRGQDMVNDIIKKKDTIYTDVQYPISTKGARQVYDRTREVLNKLQSLGQFTEQYGARGTYDDLLETLLDQNKSNDFLEAIGTLPDNLPEGQRKKIATSIRSILGTMSKKDTLGARFKAKEVLSGVPDKDLNDALFSTKSLSVKKKQELEDAGLGIYMNGEIDTEKLGYKDLKRLLFLGTQKMNRGGLASHK
tara:strand:- start:14069 stop:16063 length:1995 start_codon:yes stop_codon:yes gene_type:complete